ncbi:hypothetical protein [Enterococcus nangangensis]|uniref:hypothetical protein n=1 Tax=Enterococcus nangangensis TaxID=2559926 RepID=UPI0010F9C3C9|nr:hypothetical protein [Enterococcus nangangensis]
MGEIVFNKSQKNLKKVYNRLNSNNLSKYVKSYTDKVLFLAVGGYNRTFELIQAMGADKDDIATFSTLNLTKQFLMETHQKKVIYIKKINYTTSVNKNLSFTVKKLDLNVADAFEESMMVYATAQRFIGDGKQRQVWDKPTVVVLDDQSLNLQYEGHRFRYQNDIGFVQIRNRNADPKEIIKEIENVDEAEKMMFALYQMDVSTEAEVINVLTQLSQVVQLKIDDDWAIKPAEFKRIAGSQNLATQIKEMPELGIYQLSSNKKIGKENARWIIIPEHAFNFTGFTYKDEDEIFAEQIEMEEQAEQRIIAEQETKLQKILSIEIPFNIRIGYTGNQLSSSVITLQTFLNDIDDIESEKVNGIELLEGATTEQEYKAIKKNNLVYFLDGNYKNDERKDENYLGGRRLISIDVDDGDYNRAQIESRIETQGLFALVYPTAKHYYDNSNRWRIVMMADGEMSKKQYKQVVAGVAEVLMLEIDEASKKVSQLMGYPLAGKDVSVLTGSLVSIDQFVQEEIDFSQSKNVVPFTSTSKKSLADFNHPQAELLRKVLNGGVEEGRRNETYRQVYMYLRDTLNKPEMEIWHAEALELIEITKQQALTDGLPEKEVEVIYR